MIKSFEEPLKSTFSIADTFYVSLLVNDRNEILPIEVSFEDVFYDLIQIKTLTAIEGHSEVIVNMYNDDVVYNITGDVMQTVKDGCLYKSTIRMESLPTKLFNELINMMKETLGEVNQK